MEVASRLGIKAEDSEALQLLVELARTTDTGSDLVGLVQARKRAAGADGEEVDAVAWVGGGTSATATPAPTKFTTPAGVAARAAATAANDAHASAVSELEKTTKEAELDFGPGGAFYPLKGKCFDLKVNQYSYEACPFAGSQQDSTSLGRWEGWGSPPNYKVLSFVNGQTCWHGPARVLKLALECGVTDALLSVEETEKCVYEGRFATPAACDPHAAQALKQELAGEPAESKRGEEL